MKASMVYAIDRKWKTLCCGSLFEPDLALFPEKCYTQSHAYTVVIQHRELKKSARYYILLGIKPIESLEEGIVALKVSKLRKKISFTSYRTQRNFVFIINSLQKICPLRGHILIARFARKFERA